MDRKKLRELIRARRESISVIQAAELSARIAERAIALPEYRAARSVMCYASLLGEVQTQALNARILSDGKRLFLPRITPDKTRMQAAPLEDLRDVVRGAMGIWEPAGDAEVDPGELELIFVPGIAFDRRGGRVGFGGGYYDRFLPGTKALRVGLAFDMQLVEDTAPEEHDQGMDILVTESAVLDLRPSAG